MKKPSILQNNSKKIKTAKQTVKINYSLNIESRTPYNHLPLVILPGYQPMTWNRYMAKKKKKTEIN